MTCDGLRIKLQDTHFYDLTVHFFKFKKNGTLDEQVCGRMVCRTLLLTETVSGETVSDLRLLLSSSLHEKNYSSLSYLCKTFTFVTDCAAVMPNIVGASISQIISPLIEMWMVCFAHQTHTAMNLCMRDCKSDPFLKDICDDLKAAKTLVRIFKQSGLNHELSAGFNLIQDVETIFSRTFYVAQCFIKSGPMAFVIALGYHSTSAHDAVNSIDVKRDSYHKVIGFSALEAIVNACAVVVDAQRVL